MRGWIFLQSLILAVMVLAKENQVSTIVEYPRQAITQAFLDLPEVDVVLKLSKHNEQNGLILTDRLIGKDMKLKKFGKSVKVVADQNISGNYVRFKYFDCKHGNYCAIVLEYPSQSMTVSGGVWIGAGGSLKFEKVSAFNEK